MKPQQDARPAPTPSWLALPTLESSDPTVRGFLQTHLQIVSPRRRWQTQRAATNLWFYLGRQWIEALTAMTPTDGAYQFREVYRQSNAAFPRPVTNMLAAAVDNEMSRLSRKQYVPDTSAGKNKPEWIAAAKLAKEICMFEMGKQLWDDKREQIIFNLLIESIAITRTWWDENDLETTLVASPDAVMCPTCKLRLQSPTMPTGFIRAGIPSLDGSGGRVAPFHTESMTEVQLRGEMTADQATELAQVRMMHCPYCEGLSALQPFDMSEEEAAEQDVFGRQMGLRVPRGEGLIDVLSVHEYFPENGGIGVEPLQQRVFGQVKVRPLEWIAMRFPELRNGLAKEEPGLLLKHNPLYAERAFHSVPGYGGFGSGWECYDNHARVFELVISPQPFPGLEEGAHFAMIGDKIVRRPLCVKVQTEKGSKLVPRVRYHFARFKRIPGNFWSRSFVDDFVPLQQRYNEIDAQGIDLRERGKPTLYAPEGTEIRYDEDEVYGSMNVCFYDSELATWSPREGFFPGVPMNASPYAEERAQVLRDMQALGFPQDIEMGQSPGSVKTTSGLMLLSEEAAQKRAPREQALIRLYESAFEHILEMNWAFRKEDAEYEATREAGMYELGSFTGSDLVDGIKVKMNARVNYDQVLYNKEATAEGIQLGLIKIDSPDAVDRALELMKLPKDINENQTLQVIRAEAAWSRFMRTLVVPPIDKTIHDARAWYAVLGKRWFTDECVSMQERSGWPQIVPRISTWEERLAQIEAQEALSKPIYGDKPQSSWQAIYDQGTQLVQQVLAAHQKAQATFEQTSATAPPGAPPLQPPAPPAMQEFPAPPPQGFLPDPIEQRIYTVWRRMMPEFDAALLAAREAKRVEKILPAGLEASKIGELDALLRIRAVIEGYRILALEAAVGAVMGMGPGAAAPPPPGGPGGPGTGGAQPAGPAAG